MLKPGNPTSRSGTIMVKSWTLERGLCYKYIDLAPNMFLLSFILFICSHFYFILFLFWISNRKFIGSHVSEIKNHKKWFWAANAVLQSTRGRMDLTNFIGGTYIAFATLFAWVTMNSIMVHVVDHGCSLFFFRKKGRGGCVRWIILFIVWSCH